MTPVNTSAKVRKLQCSPDAVALVDVLLVSFVFYLAGGPLMLAPGVAMELPELPSGDSGDATGVADDVSVLSARGDNMIIFDGAIYSTDSFSRLMKERKARPPRGASLLIKADKSVGVQTLIDICRAAKNGGFSIVQIAAKPSD